MRVGESEGAMAGAMNIDQLSSGPLPRRSSGPKPSQATRDAIVTAAREILQEGGLRAFRFEAIARRAKAGKPTLYRWWKSRYELVLETLSTMAPANVAIIPDQGSLYDDLAAHLGTVWSAIEDKTNYQSFSALLAEMQMDPKAMKFAQERFLPDRRLRLAAVFDRAKQRGELSPTFDPKIAIDIVIGISVMRHAYGLRMSQAEIEQVSRFISIAAGCKGHAPRPTRAGRAKRATMPVT